MPSESEQLAELYESHHAQGAKYRYTVAEGVRSQIAREWVGQGGRVLDVGCRDGSFTASFAPGNEVVGIDIDRRALQRCGERLGIETRWVNIGLGLPFDDASFDVVNCAEVMEHLPNPQHVVAEIHRVLRPGGRFVGSVPNAFRLLNRVRFLLGRDFETDPTHLHSFSSAGLRRLLGGHFEAIAIRYIEGRFVSLWPRMMANTQCFRATRLATAPTSVRADEPAPADGETPADRLAVGERHVVFSIEPAGDGYGLWHHHNNAWFFGGDCEPSRSLRACRTSLAVLLGLEPVTTVPCPCGGLAQATRQQPWDGPAEVYDVRCPACGREETLPLDRAVASDLTIPPPTG